MSADNGVDGVAAIDDRVALGLRLENTGTPEDRQNVIYSRLVIADLLRRRAAETSAVAAYLSTGGRMKRATTVATIQPMRSK